jgi:hypothetical protein
MQSVPVVLNQFQYEFVEKLRAEGVFGNDDADIIKRVFLRWCGENGLQPKTAAPRPESKDR